MNDLTRSIISLVIVAAGIGGFLLMGKPSVPTLPPGQPDAPIVKLATAVEHTDGIQFEVDGVVVPFRQIQIAAQVAGRIAFKADACRVGRAVKHGDLLIGIEKNDYEIEVRRLREELNQANAMLAELDAETVTAENQIASGRQQLEIEVRQLERRNDLGARRITSDAEVDEARRAELISRNSLQTLMDQKNLLIRRRVRMESAIALKQADLEKAELALERTEIRSPLDGVVVAENVEQDGFIQSGSTLVTLQDSSQLDVTCKLHMRQMNWLWQGQGEADAEQGGELSQAYDFPQTPATLIYELGGSSYEWQGVVDRYDGAGIDTQTRMIPCRVHVDDPLSMNLKENGEAIYAPVNPPTLMTGMFVKVRIDARPPIPLVRLPQAAIQPGNKVWTVHEGKLLRKEVSVATSDADFAVAYQQVGGLQAGDVVVVSPLATPMDGLPILDIDNMPPEIKPQGAGGWGAGRGAGRGPGGGSGPPRSASGGGRGSQSGNGAGGAGSGRGRSS